MAFKRKPGRPKKKPVELFVEKKVQKRQADPVPAPAPVIEPLPVAIPAGPVCTECGKPVAPGQTYVCLDHIRRN